MNLQQIGWGGVDWADVTYDRGTRWAVVKTVMNRRVAQNSGNFSSSWQTAAFCRMTMLHAVVGQPLC